MTILKPTCLILLSAAAVICADPGSSRGRIVTAAGAGVAVPKAPIEAKNVATQASYKATSAADGIMNYKSETFEAVLPAYSCRRCSTRSAVSIGTRRMLRLPRR